MLIILLEDADPKSGLAMLGSRASAGKSRHAASAYERRTEKKTRLSLLLFHINQLDNSNEPYSFERQLFN